MVSHTDWLFASSGMCDFPLALSPRCLPFPPLFTAWLSLIWGVQTCHHPSFAWSLSWKELNSIYCALISSSHKRDSSAWVRGLLTLQWASHINNKCNDRSMHKVPWSHGTERVTQLGTFSRSWALVDSELRKGGKGGVREAYNCIQHVHAWQQTAVMEEVEGGAKGTPVPGNKCGGMTIFDLGFCVTKCSEKWEGAYLNVKVKNIQASWYCYF